MIANPLVGRARAPVVAPVVLDEPPLTDTDGPPAKGTGLRAAGLGAK